MNLHPMMRCGLIALFLSLAIGGFSAAYEGVREIGNRLE